MDHHRTCSENCSHTFAENMLTNRLVNHLGRCSKTIYRPCSPRCSYTIALNIRPLLDHRLKGRNARSFEKGSLVFTFSVCVCVCSRPTGHNFWPSNLNFCMTGPWDMSKKGFFPIFKILIFVNFMGIFRFFPYIKVIWGLFAAFRSQFLT